MKTVRRVVDGNSGTAVIGWPLLKTAIYSTFQRQGGLGLSKRTPRGILSSFVGGALIAGIISSIVLGAYFGVAFLLSGLHWGTYSEADSHHINDIINSRQDGVQVTVRGPVVAGGALYFAIWDHAPGHMGIDVYYSILPPPGTVVEVNGTTAKRGTAIYASSVNIIEPQPIGLILPTFGDWMTNIRYMGLIVLGISLAAGSISAYRHAGITLQTGAPPPFRGEASPAHRWTPSEAHALYCDLCEKEVSELWKCSSCGNFACSECFIRETGLCKQCRSNP